MYTHIYICVYIYTTMQLKYVYIHVFRQQVTAKLNTADEAISSEEISEDTNSHAKQT